MTSKDLQNIALRMWSGAGMPIVRVNDPSPYRGLKPVTTPPPAAGRNHPCPCASGKKYKLCCLRKKPEEKNTEPAKVAAVIAVDHNGQ